MLEKLELLLHLARERHFGRAAEAAGISQPSLSSAVKSLEEQFGILIVERGSRFRGFTPEGEKVLGWARRLVTDSRAMRSDIESLRKGLAGTLRLAVIPTALPFVATLTEPICDRHDAVRFRIHSTSHDQIVAGLEAFDIDVGMTYLDDPLSPALTAAPLFFEHYSLVVSPDNPMSDRESIGWAEAGTAPLCLLTPDMQHRRFVDRHLSEAGIDAAPRIESNSLVVLMSHVRTGSFASILPSRFVHSMDPSGSLCAVPITEPSVSHRIGLLVRRRDPRAPLVQALLDEARRVADTSI